VQEIAGLRSRLDVDYGVAPLVFESAGAIAEERRDDSCGDGCGNGSPQARSVFDKSRADEKIERQRSEYYVAHVVERHEKQRHRERDGDG
jgi:hypothetical protein